jgi:quercetin dioxygenase-like cupin family protein
MSETQNETQNETPSEELLHTGWQQIPVETLSPLLTRQFVHGSQAMVARLVLKTGCIVPWHVHPNEQISQTVSGALRFLLGDQANPVEKIVRAGEVLVIPGNLPHYAEALEETVAMDVFAPPRQDWISGNDSYLR